MCAKRAASCNKRRLELIILIDNKASQGGLNTRVRGNIVICEERDTKK